MARWCLLVCLVVASFAAPVAAQERATDEPKKAAPDEATLRGRAAYLKGVELTRNEHWGEALVAFRQSAAARNAPLVQFNIGYCLRALGRYVAARQTLLPVLAKPTGLASEEIEDTRAYLAEMERAIVRVEVTLAPIQAKLSLDGRPLVKKPGKQSGVLVLLGSFAAPGNPTSPGARKFTVELDPGAHLFRAQRPGHQDAMVRRSYRAGQRAQLNLELDELPATIRVESTPSKSIVRMDRREVGLTPIEFERPAGRYLLEVERDGFKTYKATLLLSAGQRNDLTASLEPYVEPIYKKWWFWTGAAAVIAGGAVLTWALTRPDPVPPPYDSGSTGWVVQPQGWRF